MLHRLYMEITTFNTSGTGTRRAAVNALAFVGFIALLILGISLAIYSASYLPKVASRVGSAAVSLSSIFNRTDNAPQLNVVTATTTLPFEAPVVATTTATKPKPVTTPVRTAGETITTVTTTSAAVAPYGNPDLQVKITGTGYLTTSDTNSFVAATAIPSGKRGAVKFTVTNTGTNVSGVWKFDVKIPTSPSYTYHSSTQQSLAPGDSIDFVLGFDRARNGTDREITVTVDSNNDVHESNENNNTDSATIDIGS